MCSRDSCSGFCLEVGAGFVISDGFLGKTASFWVKGQAQDRKASSYLEVHSVLKGTKP